MFVMLLFALTSKVSVIVDAPSLVHLVVNLLSTSEAVPHAGLKPIGCIITVQRPSLAASLAIMFPRSFPLHTFHPSNLSALWSPSIPIPRPHRCECNSSHLTCSFDYSVCGCRDLSCHDSRGIWMKWRWNCGERFDICTRLKSHCQPIIFSWVDWLKTQTFEFLDLGDSIPINVSSSCTYVHRLHILHIFPFQRK